MPVRSFVSFAFVLLLTVCGSVTVGAEEPKFTSEQIQFFEREIRPLLATHCYSCHSADAKRLEAGLYVDSRAGLLTGGDSGESIVPGKPEESLLIEAVKYESYEMPPKGKLPEKEIAKLERWIEMGAPWPAEAGPKVTKTKFDWRARKAAHWSWQPITNPSVPAVGHEDWANTSIDRFVLKRLEERDLLPSPPANRSTLVRRVYLDLIGLPPTPEQVRAFVDDPDPNAYEKLVDELLESPHFGEKWARHWMDLVRFAETHGHEFDYAIPHTTPYRDYLIRAFNADVPYDQLVREHVAGDLLDNPRRHPTEQFNESVIGTAFWNFGEATHSPVDVRKDEADRIDNQIDVFSRTFLGLTVSCARCHDHKFDPIPTADYYALAGFLKSTRRTVAHLDPGRRIETAHEQLTELQKEASDVLARERPWDQLTGEEFTRYLLATREAFTLAAKSPTETRADRLLDDFESGYDGWTATGDAFGTAPSTGTTGNQQRVSGFLGKGLVNTYRGSDRPQGTLTSQPFPIDRRYLRFLIGGGHHRGQTCLNLEIDGVVLFSEVGRGPQDRERLTPRTWDLSDHQGKTGRLVIVDRHSGGWGHINVDHIMLSDTTTSTTAPNAVSQAIVERVATERQLDAKRLRAMIGLLNPARTKDATDPLWPAMQMVRRSDAEVAAEFKRLGRLAADRRSRDDGIAQEAKRVFRFDHDDPHPWKADGFAFRDASESPDRVAADLPSGPGRIETRTTRGGSLSPKFRGVFRSPPFTIDTNHIDLRVRAKNVSIRLIIDGYFLQTRNRLLFGNTDLATNQTDTQGEFRWLRLGNPKYLGHRAWLEIHDEGNGFCEIDEMRLTNVNRQEAPFAFEGLFQTTEEIDGFATLAIEYGREWDRLRRRLDDGSPRATDGEWHNLLVGAGVIPVPEPLVQIEQRRLAIERGIPAPLSTQAVADAPGEDERIFIRGSHERLGDVVPRRMLLAIAGENQPAPDPATSGRLELAERLLADDNPFPARVMVNRLWHHVFGRGLVPSVDDFGMMGRPPTHPELLDHLAWQFRADGWSIKNALRRMVLSRTYRQSSTAHEPNHPALELDPANTLLSRMPIRRMTAEVLRDSMLTVSGRLDPTIFGNSVPVHLTPFMQGRGRPRSSGPVDGNGRRSLYTSINRNFLPSLLLTFDFPVPFSTRGRRTVSNVPAQALVLLNDPFVLGQAKLWAEKLIAEHPDFESRLEAMFLAGVGRSPTFQERSLIAEFRARRGGEDEVAIWSDLCHMMFNRKEFFFIR